MDSVCAHQEARYDPRTETTELAEDWVSAASAVQRAGRAGRCRDGTVYRLYSAARFANFRPSAVPELLRVPIYVHSFLSPGLVFRSGRDCI